MANRELLVQNRKVSTVPDEIVCENKWEIVQIVASRCRVNRVNSFNCFPNVQLLDLGHNNLGAMLNRSSFIFEGLDQLLVLGLQHNKITSLNEHIFVKCQSLRHLDLSHNQLCSSFRCLSNLSKLQILNLSNNQIDNVCQFKPLRNKLPNLLCIMLTSNPMEDWFNYYEQASSPSTSIKDIVKKKYFPQVEFIDTQLSRVKIQDVMKMVHQIDPLVGSALFSTNEQPSQNYHPEYIHQGTIPRSASSNQLTKQDPQQRTRSLTPTMIGQTQQINCSIAQREDQQDFLQETLDEQSIIREESKEYSLRSFLSPEDKRIFQDIMSPSKMQFLLGARSKSKSQSKSQKMISSDKRAMSRDSSRSRIQPNENSVDSFVIRYLAKGTLTSETQRQIIKLEYLRKELEKVDNSLYDEKRQEEELTKLCLGFEELVQQCLCLNEHRSNSFSKIINQLQTFATTIDIFASSKVNELVMEIIKPFLSDEEFAIDQQLNGIDALIDRLKKCIENI